MASFQGYGEELLLLYLLLPVRLTCHDPWVLGQSWKAIRDPSWWPKLALVVASLFLGHLLQSSKASCWHLLIVTLSPFVPWGKDEGKEEPSLNCC